VGETTVAKWLGRGVCLFWGLTVKSEEKRAGSLGGSFHPSQPNERVGIRKLTDGKVMTITDEGSNRKGEKFSQVLVFDRE
jgi:hypothetical protein